MNCCSVCAGTGMVPLHGGEVCLSCLGTGKKRKWWAGPEPGDELTPEEVEYSLMLSAAYYPGLSAREITEEERTAIKALTAISWAGRRP